MLIFLAAFSAVRTLGLDESLEESDAPHVIVFTDLFVGGAAEVFEVVQKAVKNIKIDVVHMDCDVYQSKCLSYGMMRPLDVVYYNLGRPIRYPYNLTEKGLETFVRQWLMRDSGKYEEVREQINATAYATFTTSNVTECLKMQFHWPDMLIECKYVKDITENNLAINWANKTIKKYNLDTLSEQSLKLILFQALKTKINHLYDVRQLISAREGNGALIFTSTEYNKELEKFVSQNDVKEEIFIMPREQLLQLSPIRFRFSDLDVIFCYQISSEQNGYQHYKIDPSNFEDSLKEALQRVHSVRKEVERAQKAGLSHKGVDYMSKWLFGQLMSTIAYQCIDKSYTYIVNIIGSIFGGKTTDKAGCDGCGGKCGDKCGRKCGQGCGGKCGGNCDCKPSQAEAANSTAQEQAQVQQTQQNVCQCPKCQLQRIQQSGCQCQKCQEMSRYLISLIQTQNAQMAQKQQEIIPFEAKNDDQNVKEALEEGLEEEEDTEQEESESDYMKYSVDNKKED